MLDNCVQVVVISKSVVFNLKLLVRERYHLCLFIWSIASQIISSLIVFVAYDFESHVLIAHPELLDPGAGLLGEIDSYNR